jgi:hypothetical protein
MENQATWTETVKVIETAIAEANRQQEAQICGLSTARIVHDALEKAGLLAEVTGRDSEIERSLVATRACLYRHSQNLEHRQPKGLGRPSPTGTEGWAVTAIPDWDVRQRIAEIDKALEATG